MTLAFLLVVWLPVGLFGPRASLATVNATAERVRIVLSEPTQFDVGHLRLSRSSELLYTVGRARISLEAGVSLVAERVGDGALALVLHNEDAPGQDVGLVTTDAQEGRALPNDSLLVCWSTQSPGAEGTGALDRNVVVSFSGSIDIGDEIAPKATLLLLQGRVDIHESPAFPFSTGRFRLVTEELDTGDRVSLGILSENSSSSARGFIYAGRREAIAVVAHAPNSAAKVSRYGSAARSVTPSFLARTVNDPILTGLTSALILVQAIGGLVGSWLSGSGRSTWPGPRRRKR